MKKIFKIFSFIKFILTGNIRLTFNLRKTKFLLVDHFREKDFKIFLNNKYNFEILDLRFDKFESPYSSQRNYVRVFINFKIIFWFLYYYFKKTKFSFFKSYVGACIKIMDPKIITDLSKYGFLLEISEFFPQIKFVFSIDTIYVKENFDKDLFSYDMVDRYPFHTFVINFLKTKNKSYKNLFFLLTGQKDMDILRESLDLKKTNFLINGSYKVNFLKENEIDRIVKNKYNIIFISQIDPHWLDKFNTNETHQSFNNFMIKDTIKILELLSNYVKKKNLSCLIQLREQTSKVRLEKAFYENFFKDYSKIYFNKLNDILDSYKSIVESEIVISSHSQLSYEALALNKKSLIIPLNFSKYYRHYPEKYNDHEDLWEWTISDKNLNDFEIKLDSLINMPYDKYSQYTKNKREYIISKNSSFQLSKLFNLEKF